MIRGGVDAWGSQGGGEGEFLDIVSENFTAFSVTPNVSYKTEDSMCSG